MGPVCRHAPEGLEGQEDLAHPWDPEDLSVPVLLYRLCVPVVPSGPDRLYDPEDLAVREGLEGRMGPDRLYDPEVPEVPSGPVCHHDPEVPEDLEGLHIPEGPEGRMGLGRLCVPEGLEGRMGPGHLCVPEDPEGHHNPEGR